MTTAADPDYVPTGTRNKSNAHNEKNNHVKIAKNAASKSQYT